MLASLLEKAMAPHSSTLAWKIPWTEEPGGLQFIGSWRDLPNPGAKPVSFLSPALAGRFLTTSTTGKSIVAARQYSKVKWPSKRLDLVKPWFKHECKIKIFSDKDWLLLKLLRTIYLRKNKVNPIKSRSKKQWWAKQVISMFKFCRRLHLNCSTLAFNILTWQNSIPG